MRRPAFFSLLACLVLGAAAARAEAEARFLGGLDTELASLQISGPTTACRMGNLAVPAGFMGRCHYWGHNNYILRIDPLDSGCECPAGFKPTAMHLLIMTPGTDPTPCSISIDIRGPDPNSSPSCPQPYGLMSEEKDIICGTFAEVTLPFPGFYELIVPVDCGCAFFQYTYFVHFYYGLSNIDILSAQVPGSCRTFSYQGIGGDYWVQDESWRGSPILWFDAECCDPPVGAEQRSWGAVKQLYR